MTAIFVLCCHAICFKFSIAGQSRQCTHLECRGCSTVIIEEFSTLFSIIHTVFIFADNKRQ